jgi:CheY-like chemotaxis protein
VSSLSILVVDDFESVRRLVRRVLEHAGPRVLEAGDGLEALARLAENPTVDLVITDLRMPGMDGWQLATHLVGRSPRLPVLFMSGFDEHLASDTVAGPVLPKPFSPEQLEERIRQVLGGERTARRA